MGDHGCNRPANEYPGAGFAARQDAARTFDDGPSAGKTYEHTFNPDGSVVYRSIQHGSRGKSTRERQCAVDKVNDQVFVVSYLGASGYTLTVALDFSTHRMIGFASNEEAWYRQQGTFEVIGEAKAER